jgi:hypothetical protein
MGSLGFRPDGGTDAAAKVDSGTDTDAIEVKAPKFTPFSTMAECVCF